MFANMSAPPGYNLNTMREIAAQVEERLQPAVRAGEGGDPADALPLPPVKYASMSVDAGGLRVISEPLESRDIEALMDALTAVFREFPGMRAFAARGSIISSNDGGSRSINLDVSGPDLDSIYRVAQLLEARAAQVLGNPRIQSQPSALSLAQPLIQLRPDWERAASIGLSAEDLGYTVAALTDGAYVDEFFLGDDKIDMYLYRASSRDLVLDRLGQLPIYTPTGSVISLGSLVTLEETVDTSAIRRVGGRRTVTLNVVPPRSIALETGVAIVREDVVAFLRDRGEIPQSVAVSITGAADQLDATRESLVGNYLVALFIIYLLMVAIFNHWGYPLLILTTIPVGVAGGIVGLVLLNAVGAHDIDAGIPDSHGHGRQQPHSRRAQGAAECPGRPGAPCGGERSPAYAVAPHCHVDPDHAVRAGAAGVYSRRRYGALPWRGCHRHVRHPRLDAGNADHVARADRDGAANAEEATAALVLTGAAPGPATDSRPRRVLRRPGGYRWPGGGWGR